MAESLWIALLVLVVLAAVLAPVATLRYLALLERDKAERRKTHRDDRDGDGPSP
ncbi:hypothetical protein [Thiohalorhabdus denitrificans]|uniref:Uncharacterized protein n=1 Tax=Thiohalorhabdus denitrificans TaxID=381306 RepID=A0A1G5ADH8_9GAMM|nr:hypothetical protein [Thiohalorhabdus denitrificans]SCX75942.1 hypothetical protein SAMN05661077_0277 [Thiohalorhabdus denitrificans]